MRFPWFPQLWRNVNIPETHPTVRKPNNTCLERGKMYLAWKPVRHKHGIKQSISISHKCSSHILNSYSWKNLEHLSNMKWPFIVCFVSCSPAPNSRKINQQTLPAPKSNKTNALSQLLHATHLTNVIPCQNQLLFLFPTRSEKKLYEELDIIFDARFPFKKKHSNRFGGTDAWVVFLASQDSAV